MINVRVGCLKPPLLTICRMHGFESPIACTDFCFFTVQSTNSAGDDVNKMEQCFVVFVTTGVYSARISRRWEADQQFSVKQHPQAVLQLFGVLHREQRMNRAHLSDCSAHQSNSLNQLFTDNGSRGDSLFLHILRSICFPGYFTVLYLIWLNFTVQSSWSNVNILRSIFCFCFFFLVLLQLVGRPL